MTERILDKVAGLLDDALDSALDAVHVVKNDTLHTSLMAQDEFRPDCGVGLHLSLVHDPPLCVPSDHYAYITIVESVESNSPASRAGIRAGDVVVRVDGTELDYGREVHLPDDVADRIRGPEGSRVYVSVYRREVDRRMEFELTREPAGARAGAAGPIEGEGKGATPTPVTPEFSRKRAPGVVAPGSQ